MQMNERMLAGMDEALGLVSGGRPVEATAAIQSLHGAGIRTAGPGV